MKFLLFIIAICFSVTLNAQSFFKPIPKQHASISRITGVLPDASTGDITFYALRPIASAVTLYIDGDVQAAAGGGISYQNITQKASDGRNYVNYAFNLIVAAGGTVTNTDNKSNIGKAVAYISALNNTVGLGYGISSYQDQATQKNKWKGGLAVVWTYNFNN